MKKISEKALAVFLCIIAVLSPLTLFSLAYDGANTSTDYRYENKFLTAKLFYNNFAVISDTTFPIPGLVCTDVLGDSCSCMTPQGLCVSEDYVFISAYCSVNKYKTELEENLDFGSNAEKLLTEENHITHNSVIYIIDRESGEYIKNMVLPDTNHVGGLAFDGKNLLIAKSSDEQISIISSKQIERVLATKSRTVAVEYDYSVDCGCTASFVTYHDGIVWVGVFNENEEGELNGFIIDSETNELNSLVNVKIPAKANGACFAELDGEICLAVNCSYGRKNISQIILFTVTDYGKEDMAINQADKYNAPPTVQNSCVYDGRVYYIYESAATCYSEVESAFDIKSTSCAIDRVCIGDADKLFNWHCQDNIASAKLKAFVEALAALVGALVNI